MNNRGRLIPAAATLLLLGAGWASAGCAQLPGAGRGAAVAETVAQTLASAVGDAVSGAVDNAADGVARRVDSLADRARGALEREFSNPDALLAQAQGLLDDAGALLPQGTGVTGAARPEEPAIVSAVWATRDDEGGQTLMITPAAWTRATGLAWRDDVWAELVAAVPEADVPGMRDQLVCHMIGAPQKETWNIEPWRPAVGLEATLRARCNP